MPPIVKLLPLLLLLPLLGCDENQFTDVIGDHWIKDPQVCAEDTTPVSFKKIAYWSPDESDNLTLVNYQQLTHVIYSSIVVNVDGTLVVPEDVEPLEDLVLLAHGKNTKVAISIIESGESDNSAFNTIASDKAIKKQFVSNVAEFITDYDLDGIDIDWREIDAKDESTNQKLLLEALSEKLIEEGKFLSMTVPSGEDSKQANKISYNNFEYVDFVNVLAFDSTNKDGLHSSMQDAEDAITYWSDRCIISNKLVLGVPFYSQGSAVRSYDYLIRDDISYACLDESERRNYNGIPTIIDKTNYALLNAGGMMMKSLEQDIYMRNNDDFDFTDYSLLNVINETVLGNELSVCQ